MSKNPSPKNSARQFFIFGCNIILVIPPVQTEPFELVPCTLLTNSRERLERDLLHIDFSSFFLFFFRISNVAPNVARAYDHTRHLANGDVIFGSPGAHLRLKWAKVMQNRNKYQVVQIPELGNIKLCPVTTVSVTQAQIRSALALI